MTIPNTAHFFWHGIPLPYFQQCAVRSWLNNGWEVHFWAYSPDVAPAGTVYRDASTLYPIEDVSSFSHGPTSESVAAFSDLIRLKILSQNSGIWSDADNFCLRPYREWAEMMDGRRIICGQEPDQEYLVATGVLSFPDRQYGELMLSRAESILESSNRVLDRWATIGPLLLTDIIRENDLGGDVCPERFFYPVRLAERFLITTRRDRPRLQAAVRDSYSFHFWNYGYVFDGVSTNGRPAQGSFLDWVIRRYCN
jgi:hypothetical protein